MITVQYKTAAAAERVFHSKITSPPWSTKVSPCDNLKAFRHRGGGLEQASLGKEGEGAVALSRRGVPGESLGMWLSENGGFCDRRVKERGL